MIKHTLYQTANFELIEFSDIDHKGAAYERLRVIPHGLAKKHVVSIELNWDYMSPEAGNKDHPKYTGAYVNHGMRCACDTLDETREYIGVLTEAVIFIDNTIDMVRNW